MIGKRTKLAFYREIPDAAFWTEHWRLQSFEHLYTVATASQLTRYLERYVRPGDRLLEAGCGLGQYVQYFAERGARTTGVDFSGDVIDWHREHFPEADVHVADVAELPFPSASFDVYLSLGVVEHSPEGPRAILEEAARVVKPGGVLLISTPYVNGMRRLLGSKIEAEQEAVRSAGGDFYQYAFTERFIDAELRNLGLRVIDRKYYDPGRGLREACSRFATRRGGTGTPVQVSRPPKSFAVQTSEGLGRVLRGLLYSAPVLRAFAHMQLVVARTSAAEASSQRRHP